MKLLVKLVTRNRTSKKAMIVRALVDVNAYCTHSHAILMSHLQCKGEHPNLTANEIKPTGGYSMTGTHIFIIQFMQNPFAHTNGAVDTRTCPISVLCEERVNCYR